MMTIRLVLTLCHSGWPISLSCNFDLKQISIQHMFIAAGIKLKKELSQTRFNGAAETSQRKSEQQPTGPRVTEGPSAVEGGAMTQSER